MNFKDAKDWGRAGLGGVITAIGGNYLLPVVNSLITFIPQKAILLGVTPHAVVAYGLAFAGAMWVNDKVIK